MKTDNDAEALGPSRDNIQVPARDNHKTGGLLSHPLIMTEEENVINDGRMKFCNRLNKFLPAMVTTRPKRIFPEKEVLNKGKVVCFKRLLAGIGMLAEHCHDDTNHGLDQDKEDCNVGRAPLYWAFRVHAMSMLGVTEERSLCTPGHRSPLQVLDGIDSHLDLDLDLDLLLHFRSSLVSERVPNQRR